MRAWDQFVETQVEELGQETVDKWLHPIKVVRYDAGNLYLEAADAFFANWFEEHMRVKVDASLKNGNNRKIRVHLGVAGTPNNAKSKRSKDKAKEGPAFTLAFDKLDPRCTYSTFIPFDSNRLTYQVFTDSNSSGGYNPIFVHGGKGAGKTHLLMAAAHLLREGGKKAIYAHAATFTDHFVTAIRAGEMSLFRHAYRNCDVLIVDDIHLFSKKGATQEEFFHTFNTLHVAGKQVILSSNCPPVELKVIEPRLVSRFEWGIVLNLEMPTKEESLQIAAAKVKAMNFPLHPKVLQYLVDAFSTTKALAVAIDALQLRQHLYLNSKQQHDKKINPADLLTVPLVKDVLKDLLIEEEKIAMTPVKIIKGAAEHFGIRSEDLLGKAQTRDCSLPRQIAMYLCRSQLNLPFVGIGDLFGKDHSTVMTSVKLIEKGMEEDNQEIAPACRSILKKLKSLSSHDPLSS